MATSLNPFEVEAFTSFVRYHLTPELRQKFMKALPEVYNKVVGYEVVTTVLSETAKSYVEKAKAA